MKRLPYQIQVKEEKAQAGFSLVEVLVCIAIIALITIPIMAGFRTSATYTNRAHTTQLVTAYAQETLETIKSVDVDTYKAQVLSFVDADGNSGGSIDDSDVDTTLQAEFSSYSDELFRKIVCRQENINIGGYRYNMEVTFDPVDYSQKKSDTEDAFSLTSANDANVYAVNEVDAVNGMLFPVIADEISDFEGDGSVPGAVISNLESKLKKSQQTGTEEERLLAIYQNLTKKVKVTISDNGGQTVASLGGTNYVQGAIKVTCDVTYESSFNGVTLSQVYNVFSGNYELLGRLSASGEVEEWEKGGNIYVFARAYQDQYYRGSGVTAPLANTIEIVNNYSGSGKLEIYLVRGYYYTKDFTTGELTDSHGLHFDQVIVDGSTYASMPQMTPLSGEWSDGTGGNTYFHTNIKGAYANRALSPDEMKATIGMEKPSLRCYAVNIRVFERNEDGSDGDRVADIETTKEVR